MAKLKKEDVQWTLEVKISSKSILNNAIDSGDLAWNEMVAERIVAELQRDNLWAWCDVTITGSYDSITCSETIQNQHYQNELEFNIFVLPGIQKDIMAEISDRISRESRIV